VPGGSARERPAQIEIVHILFAELKMMHGGQFIAVSGEQKCTGAALYRQGMSGVSPSLCAVSLHLRFVPRVSAAGCKRLITHTFRLLSKEDFPNVIINLS
jgi:hypothetical protein